MFVRRFTKVASKGSPAARLRQVNRDDALQDFDLSTLVQSYLAREPLYLGRGSFWNWDVDGIPPWLVARFQDLNLLDG
ncbi:hypothetical protein [Cyanobium sp. Morenito 9A2]|uniref:hypothetical protein n=1 Tax=Cyanobium sp. Morenito 9A2 TaxID=2823718 RepID=UPI0020CE8AD1|nr:hypothetical protein [Cyanobium sp. Morenito 9A2]MCP9848613.1 hypothetical protein [Cyanobium sp. Morenito 9A2]